MGSGGMGDGGMGGADSGGSGAGGSGEDAAPPDTAPDLAEPDTGKDAPADGGMVPTMGLVGYWKLDDGMGTKAKDDSGSMNDGTLAAAPRTPVWTAMGAHAGSGALTFDGTDDVMTLATFNRIPALNAPKTISLWARWEALATDTGKQVILALFNQTVTPKVGLHVGVLGRRLAVWNYANLEMVGLPQPPATMWHHVTYTFDGTDHKLYLDGVMTVAAGTAGTQAGAVLTGTFGNAVPGASQPFKGSVDDVRIYDRALTPAEIDALHTASP
jgi:hypothetical protein